MTTVERFIELFEGNRIAIGTEQGGCHRILSEDWDLFVEAHLRGVPLVGNPILGTPIGVYPMVCDPQVTKMDGTVLPTEWRVHWACIDFDEGEAESWVHATNVHKALSLFDVAAWIERSRSKGYHVWVFFDSWQPAELVRSALLGVCQLVQAPTKEINPKQNKLQPFQLGNYVRLPYPGALNRPHPVDTDRRVMLHAEGGAYPVETFVEQAYRASSDGSTLGRMADLYKPPVRPVMRRDWSSTREDIDRLARWLSQQPEGERNTSLFWAACQAIDAGHDDLAALHVAAQDAGLSEREIQRTINSARTRPPQG